MHSKYINNTISIYVGMSDSILITNFVLNKIILNIIKRIKLIFKRNFDKNLI
jgi:hypothetical protein